MTYYIRWILQVIFKSPVAEFTSIQQTTNGWVAVLTDRVNGQEYVCSFLPVKNEAVPQTADQLLNMNKENHENNHN